METHIKVLAVLHIVFGALGTLGAVAVLAVFGLAGTLAGLTHGPGAIYVLPIIGLTGTALFVVILCISLPGLIAGIGLLKFKPWARVMMIVLSALHILNFPLGTVLGIYGLYVLLSEEGTRLFTRAPAQVA
jgi:hypothetical protein